MTGMLRRNMEIIDTTLESLGRVGFLVGLRRECDVWNGPKREG